MRSEGMPLTSDAQLMDNLEQIGREISVCTDCALSRNRTVAVPGEGPADAEIVLIGEAPGFNEDQQGRPFVGAAGRPRNVDGTIVYPTYHPAAALRQHGFRKVIEEDMQRLPELLKATPQPAEPQQPREEQLGMF